MKRIGVISDTHGTFDKALRDFLSDVDEIWHAGDVGSLELADEIASFKTLKAVYGNIDCGEVRSRFHKLIHFFIEDIKVTMTHIGGYPGKYAPGIKTILYQVKPDLFISGHSHILKAMYDREMRIMHLNPGAAGIYGFHKVRTLMRFEIDGKKIQNLEVIELRGN